VTILCNIIIEMGLNWNYRWYQVSIRKEILYICLISIWLSTGADSGGAWRACAP